MAKTICLLAPDPVLGPHPSIPIGDVGSQNYWTQMIQAPHKDRGAQAIRAFRRLTRLAAFGGFSTGKTLTRTLASGTEITESDSRLPQFIYHPPDLERDMEQIEILEKDAKIYVPPDWICCGYGEEFNNGDREFKVYEVWEPSETPYTIETFQSPLIKTGWRGQGYKANVVFIYTGRVHVYANTGVTQTSDLARLTWTGKSWRREEYDIPVKGAEGKITYKRSIRLQEPYGLLYAFVVDDSRKLISTLHEQRIPMNSQELIEYLKTLIDNVMRDQFSEHEFMSALRDEAEIRNEVRGVVAKAFSRLGLNLVSLSAGVLSIEEKLWDRFFYWRVAGVHPAQVLWAEKSVEIASLTGQAPTLPATIPTGPLAEAERQLRERAPAKTSRKERAKATLKEKPAKVAAKEQPTDKPPEESEEE
ncbi:MAG: hypothetical protein Q6364_13095 [Candidatus Hermodarchaeota archaeon]|nr:hypothetical protein [Candidatus Hermodarchaeota archaeon]